MRLVILTVLVAFVISIRNNTKYEKDWVSWKSKHRKIYHNKDESKRYYYLSTIFI